MNFMLTAPTSEVISTDHRRQPQRLIDFGLEVLEVSSAGFAERYSQGKTLHSGQVWWARRPHAAMRALVYACLSPGEKHGDTNLLVDLGNETSDLSGLYNEASIRLEAAYREAPVVLDMFGGGGTIGFEAAALGANAVSLDYNPLASFLQTVNLSWSQSAFQSIGKSESIRLVETVGQRVLQNAKARTTELFPARQYCADGETFAYFWTYSNKCEGCGGNYTLSKRRWLSKKAGKERYIAVTAKDGQETVRINAGEQSDRTTAWLGRTGKAACPHCGTIDGDVSIKTCTETLVATARKAKRGKVFSTISDDELEALCPPDELLDVEIAKLLAEIGADMPQSEFPRWSGIVNPAIYGMVRHADIFSKRQAAALLAVEAELMAEYRALHSVDENSARFIIGTLSALLDQLVDWNSRLSMWIPQNEQVGRGFCGPGISMIWDYAESDPFSVGPANLHEKLKRIVAAASAIPMFKNVPTVINGKAQALPLASGSVDAVVTDPPYYDNIFYNVLSDSFYAWKRPLITMLAPDLAGQPKTPEADELVASRFRQGSSASAHQWYIDELSKAVAEAARVLNPDGVFALVYGHGALKGWEAVVAAYLESGLTVQSVQPLAIERKARPRAMTSEAVNTCVVLVARKRTGSARQDTLDNLIAAMERHWPSVEILIQAGWNSADSGMAWFAKGVGELISYGGLLDADDSRALKELEIKVQQKIGDFRMSGRGSI